jgi:ABC-type polysaccharide/polyol phosphate export permease
MGFFLVMKAEIVRSFIIMRRYWFRSLTGMVIGYGMLMVLIAGFMYSQPAVEEGLKRFDDPAKATNYVLGFIIGMFAFGVVGMYTQGLQGMAQTGVLEQLCMSPHGLITNFLARTAVASVTTILYSGFMVWMVTFTVGGTLYFDPVAVLALLTLTFLNLLGFGFMVGGMVLVFKQVGQLAILIRMGLFALAIFAREELLEQGWLLALVMHALPITDAAICLKYVLVRDQGRVDGAFVSVFAHPCFYWLLASCVIWTVVGLITFKYMENWSRYKGTLGSY